MSVTAEAHVVVFVNGLPFNVMNMVSDSEATVMRANTGLIIVHYHLLDCSCMLFVVVIIIVVCCCRESKSRISHCLSF